MTTSEHGERIVNPLGHWPTTMRARTAKRRLDRAEQQLLDAQREQAEAFTEWNDLLAQTRAKFRADIPADPQLLDVLTQIEIGACGQWWWHGTLNNCGLPTFRMRGTGRNVAPERSTVKYLAEQLAGHDGTGTLYPTGSTLDVNPANRKKRGDKLPVPPYVKLG